MGKAKSPQPQKEMSEGKAIALSVLLITLGVIVAGYLLYLVISYFFPGLF